MSTMHPDDFMLLFEIVNLAFTLENQKPGEKTAFLRECSEAMAAHVDAGGTDPGGAVKPILARAQAELAPAARP